MHVQLSDVVVLLGTRVKGPRTPENDHGYWH